jgi:hypothetical protein
VLAADRREAVVVQMEVADPRHERQIEQLGELGTDLTGVGVDRVPTGEDEIERPEALEGGGERAGGGERVRSGERGIRHEHPVRVDVPFARPGDRLAERVLRARWPERDDGDAPAAFLHELDGLAHRPTAVRVHLELEPGAEESTVRPELHLLERRDLLDQNGDGERLRHGR